MKEIEQDALELRNADWLPAGSSGAGTVAKTDLRLRQQVEALTAHVELLEDCVGQLLRARPDGGRGRWDYAWLVKRLQQRLDGLLPLEARVLVAARGDEALLEIPEREAGHFPQDDKGRYAGFYPADDTAAIAHLEALRDEGYDTLVFPDSSAWWLEHYDGLRVHLETHYAETASDLVCRVFDLRRRAARPAAERLRFDRVVEQARRSLGRDPDLLDWDTDADLRRHYPELAVAVYAGETLPHVDGSIDIVAVADGRQAVLREARRVATSAVAVVSRERAVRTIEWLSPSRPRAAGKVTVMRVSEPLGDGPVRSSRFDVEERPGEDVLVWASAGVVALPGAIDALVAALRRFPHAGAAGGRILDFAGRLHHAGGVMAVDASLGSRGDGVWRPDDPTYGCVQPVDWCSSLLMATTRRAFEAAGGLDPTMPFGPWRDADFCLRLQERGYAICYDPASVAVCGRELSRALAVPVEAADQRRVRQSFAARWRTVLQSRVPRVDGGLV